MPSKRTNRKVRKRKSLKQVFLAKDGKLYLNPLKKKQVHWSDIGANTKMVYEQ